MGTRRKFLQLGISAAGWPAIGNWAFANDRVSKAIPTSLPLGIAGYTFLHVPMDQAIAWMKRLGIEAMSIKDFYLPLDSSPEKVNEVVAAFQAGGIRIYGAGVIYMKSQVEVDRAFAYAKLLGVDLIIGVPNPELIGYAEQKVKESGIRLAIHNHGPEDKLYPSPADVWEHVKGLDSRVGAVFGYRACCAGGG